MTVDGFTAHCLSLQERLSRSEATGCSKRVTPHERKVEREVREMTTTTKINATSLKLVEIVDLRPWNIDTGKREPILDEQKSVCYRCGKLHAVIYCIEADGNRYDVGSGCCNTLFGWVPDDLEEKLALQACKDKAVQAALMKHAQPIIDTINSTPIPDLKYNQSRHTCFGYDYIMTIPGNDKCGIRIHSNSFKLLRPEEVVVSIVDQERFIRIWKRLQIREQVKALYGESKTAKKIEAALYVMMNCQAEKQ